MCGMTSGDCAWLNDWSLAISQLAGRTRQEGNADTARQTGENTDTARDATRTRRRREQTHLYVGVFVLPSISDGA